MALVCALVWCAARATAAVTPVDARVGGAFTMRGTVTSALRVLGERPGQHLTRAWTLTGQGCAGASCAQLLLRRERSAHHFDRLVLRRAGAGQYAGSGRFYAALRCRGRLQARGELVPFRITVEIIQAVTIQGIPFATGLAATYDNPRRLDRTICPVGPSHDAATYTGAATPPPSPPAASFTSLVASSTTSATFIDTSAAGADHAAVVSRLWQFGDPASGAADSATTALAGHTFSAPGTYAVSLTVTDAQGLRSTVVQAVTVPSGAAASARQSSKRSVWSTAASSPANAAGRRRTGAMTA